jgi:hypothetical protein
MSDIEQVLGDFIDAWNAGRRPRVADALRRVPAGTARDELADSITAWLEVAPEPDHDPATRDAIRAEPAVARVLAAADAEGGLWPAVLPSLRERAGLSVRQVAAALVARFRLAPDDEPRTTAYVERLERGELPPEGVSRRLLDALGELLGAGAGTLADAGRLGGALRPASSGGVLFRAEGDVDERFAEELEALSRAAMTPAPAPMDEVDRLFTGGPEA